MVTNEEAVILKGKLMKHPLVNPSLAPHGFGVGNTYQRSSWKSDDHGRFNADWGAARFWQEANRLDSDFRPAEHIVHQIMPGMRTLGHTEKGDFEFDGQLYQSHDLAVMTSFAVWLSTNCGSAMRHNHLWKVEATKTNEYRVRLRKYEQPQIPGHILRHLLHTCQKGKCGHGGSRSCASFYKQATEREELVIDAFLFWMGQDSGRTYMAKLDGYIAKTAQNVYEGYKRRNTPEMRRQQFLQSTQSAS